jgi:hypothetical protein
MGKEVYIVFDGPPGPEGGRYVEVEDDAGHSVGGIAWKKREDGCWVLGPLLLPSTEAKD